MMQSHKIEVLISCMTDNPVALVEKSNIQSDVLVVNQCNENSIKEYEFRNNKNEVCKCRIINTTDRGLSKSRNIAIKNATGDICLICDDDESLDDSYPEILSNAFDQNNEYSVISFMFKMPENYYLTKKYWTEATEIDLKKALKISSWQIAFKRDDIINKKIIFDTTIGSGVTFAGGEEKIFLHDCIRKCLRILFLPITIGKISYEDSQWADKIFTKQYFIDWGYYTKKLYWGSLGATAMSFIFVLKKVREYKSKCNPIKALLYMLNGIYVKK